MAVVAAVKLRGEPERSSENVKESESIRRQTFEALVLQGLWILIRLAQSRPDRYDGRVWRMEAIRYFDEHGNQSDGAKEHRREIGFPDV